MASILLAGVEAIVQIKTAPFGEEVEKEVWRAELAGWETQTDCLVDLLYFWFVFVDAVVEFVDY